MSSPALRRAAARAHVFAALGDTTRLGLLGRLSVGTPVSITHLTQGTKLTRQGVSKHLKVLEEAGLVAATRAGREVHFALCQAPLDDARDYLGEISRQWDDALQRLQAFVER